MSEEALKSNFVNYAQEAFIAIRPSLKVKPPVSGSQYQKDLQERNERTLIFGNIGSCFSHLEGKEIKDIVSSVDYKTLDENQKKRVGFFIFGLGETGNFRKLREEEKAWIEGEENSGIYHLGWMVRSMIKLKPNIWSHGYNPALKELVRRIEGKGDEDRESVDVFSLAMASYDKLPPDLKTAINSVVMQKSVEYEAESPGISAKLNALFTPTSLSTLEVE